MLFIIGIVIILLVLFCYCACIISSKYSKYEENNLKKISLSTYTKEI